MTPSGAEDVRWAARFLPEMKRILGLVLITDAPLEEDQQHNTDLIVLQLAPVRIACRVRRYLYAQRYGREFTLRAARPRGILTELDKVLYGWGDYFLYAFADRDEQHLAAWFLGDLRIFRTFWYDCVARTTYPPGLLKANGDGSSSFRSFLLSELPREFVVASFHFPVGGAEPCPRT